MKKVALIGYSGHAYVAADIILKSGRRLLGYFEQAEKPSNPFGLPFLGYEQEGESVRILRENDYFIAVGDNELRNRIFRRLLAMDCAPPIAIMHPSAVIGEGAVLREGSMAAAGVIINPLAGIGKCVICNTACVIEHECVVGDFAHIGPGAVLAGNVVIGEQTFVGANAVIRQGIKVGSGVVIGAGAVVLKDVGDGQTIVGNPGRARDLY